MRVPNHYKSENSLIYVETDIWRSGAGRGLDRALGVGLGMGHRWAGGGVRALPVVGGGCLWLRSPVQWFLRGSDDCAELRSPLALAGYRVLRTVGLCATVHSIPKGMRVGSPV